MVGPQVKRQAVDVLREERGLGVTRACGLLMISRSLYGYRSRRPVTEGLRERICELAGEKRRYGYRRIHVLLRREGWSVNRKRTYRLYREAGLAVRRRKRKRIDHWEASRRSARAAGRSARTATVDHRGSRTGVRRTSARCLGVPGRSASELYPSREAGRERPTSRASTVGSGTSA
jgi:putative transposase